jgi:site-specific recombinase XerD
MEAERSEAQDMTPADIIDILGHLKFHDGGAVVKVDRPVRDYLVSALAARRDDTEAIFRCADGSIWTKSNQARPMRAASARARITPAINFHALRHTWASLAAMNGVPLMVVAKNLGQRT